MKTVPLAVALGASFIVLLAGVANADVPDPGLPQYANNFLGGFITPTVAPGQTLEFSFNLTNPYDDPVAVMTNITIKVGIYQYATQEESVMVDDDFPRPPMFENQQVETNLTYERLELDETVRPELSISTDDDTPHGSYFSQSTYFVRFRLEFQFEGNSTSVVLQSKGYFSDEEWDQLVSFDPEGSIVNMTYMHSLGIDGLIPDSSFGLKIPIPRWPLAALIGACCFVSFMALYYFVMDNPSRYPRLEKRFYELRGKLSQLRSKLEHRRGK
jgi:hypothetical protein